MRRGLSQRQLAAQAQLDFSYVSKIEGGRVPPPARENIEVLARVLRLSDEEREQLVTLAGTIPTEMEEWVVREPAARQLYRSISQLPAEEQERLLAKLIEQVKRDVNRGGET